jgi:hypothetical protein
LKSENKSVGGWRASPSPVSALMACGWLRPADASHPGLRLDATSSSHLLSRVTAPDGRCVVVKQVPHTAAVRQRSLVSEMFVYRLARWMPEIARAVPNPVFIDEGRHLLVVEALTTGTPWPDPSARAAIASAEVCQQLGALLAGVHQSTADMAMWPSPAAGILGMPGAVGEACMDRMETTQALMRSISNDPELAGTLNEGAAAYRARCVIHGDLRQENWLLDDRESRACLKLFDWELAGSGDPSWDLGSLVAQALLDSIHSPSVIDSLAPFPSNIEKSMRALLGSYFGQATPLDPGPMDTGRKIALYAHARLLHVACECSDQGVGEHEWPITAIVGAARKIARHTDESTRTVQSWVRG